MAKTATNDLSNVLQGLATLGALLNGAGGVSNAPTTPAKKERDYSGLLPLEEVGAIKVTMTEEEAIAFADAFTNRSTTKAGKKTFRFVQEDGKAPQVQVYVKRW